jgi:hypothetical protein
MGVIREVALGSKVVIYVFWQYVKYHRNISEHHDIPKHVNKKSVCEKLT